MNKRNRYKNQINISGIKIREIRESKNWSREYLSNKLLLETGIDISAYEFLAIAKVLNMNILILIKDFFN